VTNRDRDSVAKLLLEVADRLAKAPTETLERAKSYAEDMAARAAGFDKHGAVHAHQSGGLESACVSEAIAIRRHVAEYLTQRQPRRGDKR